MAEATEARIADLEQLLEDSRAQARKSGQTLQQRLDEQRNLVESQKKVMDTQYLEYEEKFARLIENANEEQAAQLAQFNAEISKLEQKVKNAQEDAKEEIGIIHANINLDEVMKARRAIPALNSKKSYLTNF